jgi:mannitol/fructose-specific phosphotransferase system IIA component (Ntr-type)
MAMAIDLSVLDSSLYIPELKPKRKESILEELVCRAHLHGVVRDPVLLRDTLALREKLGSTCVGKGVAIPNARSVGVIEPRLVIARSRRGIEWNAADQAPVHLILLVLSPGEFSEELHGEMVGRTAAAMRLQRNRQKLIEATSFEAVTAVLREVSP